MGTVYLGRGTGGRLVALKVIRADVADDPEFRIRFRREADNARRVARFCTAEVLDADPDADSPYLVTEFIEGSTLAATVTGKGPLEPGNLERLAVGVASALTAIHGAGIIHRDLKPSNVVLSAFGPRVIDFGIARAEDSTTHLTSDLQQLGTPAFMAPEQIQGYAVTPKVDVFAWGGVVAFAATGRQAFGTGTVTTLMYRAVHDQPDLEGIPEPLRTTVVAALAKDPADRPSSQELLLALLGQPATASTAATELEQAAPAVTQVLSGWKLPETPPRGSASGSTSAGGGAGPTAATRPAGTRPASGSTNPIPTDDALTELGAQDHGPAGPAGHGATNPQPAAAGPARRARAKGRRASDHSGPPVARADRHERRYSEQDERNPRTVVLIVVIAIAVAIVLGVVIASAAGVFKDSKKDSQRNLGAAASSAASPAAGSFTLPKSAAPVSDDTLVYGSQEPTQSNVVTVDKTGSGTKQIISGLDQGQNLLPIFSPDRRTMVYYVPSSGKLVAKAADGTGSRIPMFASGQIASLKLASDARPSFSPDGTKLAVFATTAQKALGLYVVTIADGSVKKLVIPGNRAAADPAFSPDGKVVAFWAKNPGDPNGNGGRLFTTPADGTGTFSELFAGQNADPSWSPDGNFIVFTKEATDPATGKLNRDIDIVRKDGDERARLTTDPAVDQDPVFSPDGKQIAFSSERTGTRQIFTMNADGSNQTQLTHDAFKDSAPGWFWH